tara:strand:+ start:5507 stop:6109 length:603 start_codon:yes stop_codon:yes gene_type:complete
LVKIYYGQGKCSLETDEDIALLQINFSGAIHITDKTPSNFAIMQGKKNISRLLIFKVSNGGELSDLFEYKGYFKINRAIAVNHSLSKFNCRIQSLLETADLMSTKSEDISTKSEETGLSHTYKRPVSETKINNNIINNLNSNGNLYDFLGNEYSGKYHIHLNTLELMTGATHTKDSKQLFTKKSKSKIKRNKINPRFQKI